jgi:hypothetical protein
MPYHQEIRLARLVSQFRATQRDEIPDALPSLLVAYAEMNRVSDAL